MNRGIGVVLVLVGIVVTLLGLYPSGLFGKFHGVGGFSSGHNAADVAVVVGVVLLVAGVYSLVRRQVS